MDTRTVEEHRVELDRVWGSLESAIQQILRNDKSSLFNFESVYAMAYVMVRNNEGKRLYNGLRKVVSQHLESKARQDVLASLDNNFMHTLIQAWNHHQKSMTLIRQVLIYYSTQIGKGFIHESGIRSLHAMHFQHDTAA